MLPNLFRKNKKRSKDSDRSVKKLKKGKEMNKYLTHKYITIS